MNMFNGVAIWFLMLTKRLLVKKSFVVLIAIIPFLIPLANLAMKNESGVVRVALCNVQEDGSSADAIIRELMNEESVIAYTEYSTEDTAISAVENGKADVAWIFHTDFNTRLSKYISRESIRPVVTVVAREESVRLSLTREKLFGKLYAVMVYNQYEKFVRDEILADTDITHDELKKFYDNNILPSELVEIRMQGSDEAVNAGADYLTAPLRGLMSLVVMLCGFVAAGISIKEKTKGTYTWLPEHKRVIPAFGSCMAAAVVSGGVVLISLYAGGIAGGFGRELLIMMAYIFAVASVCTAVASAFSRFEAFGALIPLMMLGMVVLCPVFFSVKAFPALRLLMPPYYYLMAVHNIEYAGYMLIYSIIALLIPAMTLKIRSLLIERYD